MNIADELQKLQQMHESGALSDAEFIRAKQAVLDSPSPPPTTASGSTQDAEASREQQTRQWAMILHLSLLAGHVVPLAGLVVPIVIWNLKKEELPGIDVHGKVVVNWIISAVIFAAICIPLIFVVVGIPLLIALGIVGIIFPIIGGIKASNGEVWKYPLAISFLK